MSFLRMIVILIVVNLFSCTSIKKVQEPEDVGLYAFNLLKSLNQTTKADYVNRFLTIEEIRELAKNEEIVTNQETRNEFKSIKKDEWIGDIEDDYYELKQDGGENGIKWSEVEYLDFVYELEDKDGITGCEGELFFKYKDVSYSVDLLAIYNGVEYKLVELNYLEEQ